MAREKITVHNLAIVSAKESLAIKLEDFKIVVANLLANCGIDDADLVDDMVDIVEAATEGIEAMGTPAKAFD